MSSPVTRPCARRALALLLNSACLVLPVAAQNMRCVDDDRFGADGNGAASETAATTTDPRATLAQLVLAAIECSQAIGASRLLAEAALSGVEETRAGKAMQGTLSGGLGPGTSSSLCVTETSALQVRASLSVRQLLYDGEHYNLRVAYINALHDRQQPNAKLLRLGRGVGQWLQ